MHKYSSSRLLLAAALTCVLPLLACSDNATSTATSSNESKQSTTDPDVIAKVGDEAIRYSELSTMMNSSAMVGLSIPALGTPERNQAMVTLLDKAISANLLYLDAKQKGTDRLTAYQNDIKRFDEAIIAMLYRDKYLIGDIEVSEQEVMDYYNQQIDKSGSLDDEMKHALTSKLRKQKYEHQKATMRERLREGVNIVINEKVLDQYNDDKHSAADTVVTIDDDRLLWQDVKQIMTGADRRADIAAFYLDSEEERLKRLDQVIDNRILASKGKAAGLEKDPSYIRRTNEFSKTRLITLHRTGLVHSWNPAEDDLKQYYVDHMDMIVMPEMRKLQMVVLKTKQEAEEVKAKIDQGEITVFQAARDYSIVPDAKTTLGEMGWVKQGSGFAELDEFTFNLEPEVLSEPVESPAGWHLVKVLDVTDAQLDNFDDPQTRQVAYRLYIQDKFSDYVVGLRKDQFDVVVFDDELGRQFKHEAEYIAQLTRQAEAEGSMTEQRETQLEEWITQPTGN